ncbi:sterol 3-beta-glucosyltransferase [Phyllosticta citribraziliensis]|uniref:sterol 3beta-glucosyltransferase n=1 Tax=Phyllosticta citribraziliensis TaxID=989973 RepID=A0ABR1LHF9_9PEZI
MASSEYMVGEGSSRKPNRKPKEPRRISFEIPERLRHGDDEDEDVSAPKSNDPRYTHRSVFDLITKAGSIANLKSRFTHDEVSESEDEDIPWMKRSGERPRDLVTDGASDPKAQTLDSTHRKHRSALSHSKILRPITKLRLRPSKDRSSTAPDDAMSSSQILPERPPKGDLPMTNKEEDEQSMSRQMRAKAGLEASALGSDLRKVHSSFDDDSSPEKGLEELAQRLMEIFQLSEREEVISEFPCWLLQTVLLQGYLYITQKHICFYAYLPKKTSEVTKSGHLAKRGRTMWNRSWFILKGDVLAYYNNASDLYFPRGRINLRYAISASLIEHKDKGKEPVEFSVTTNQRTYEFRADSATSAKEWVKLLQKVIFKSHNDGDSVKIAIPLASVMDIEENRVLEDAETIKIRAVCDEYAIDEYYFSFFGFGQEAMNVMRIMVGGSKQEADQKLDRSSASMDNKIASVPGTPRSRKSRSPVRTTLFQPQRTPDSRASGDSSRSSFDTKRRKSSEQIRTSLERGRRAFTKTQDKPAGCSADKPALSPISSNPRDSAASYALENETESSLAVQSLNDTDTSASQILNRSDVFHQNEHNYSQRRLSDASMEYGKNSQDTARSTNTDKEARLRPHTDHTASTARTRTPVQESRELATDSQIHDEKLQVSASGYGLSGIVNAGTYPFQKASGFAGYIKKRSRHMGNILASESMGYYEKVSGMWTGGKKHYIDEGLSADDNLREIVDDEDAILDNERFRKHFALPDTEKLRAVFFCHLWRVLPQYGKIYLSDKYFCFRSLLVGTRTKLVLPIKDIENVNKEKSFRLTYRGLVIVVRGHEEVFFDFSQGDVRDDCAVTLHRMLEQAKYLQTSGTLSEDNLLQAEAAKAEHELLQQARKDIPTDKQPTVPQHIDELGTTYIVTERTLNAATDTSVQAPVIFDDPHASILDFKPPEPLRITCLTIGSRGDVQPYIALCKGLLAEGHKPRIVTHGEFEGWVRSHGIDFAPVAGNPAELMRLCVETGMFTPTFLTKAHFMFRGWLSSLLETAWEGCQGTDVLIESPSTMAGVHIAEALEIPYFRAFTMPWTRTRAYPHAFAVRDHKMGGTYNFLTYVLFEEVFWKATSWQINGWRKKKLGLPATTLKRLQLNKIPFMYNFSPSVVVPPLDYSDWIRVTGYWFLDESSGWIPPKPLTDFIDKAREDGKKLVYIGFGSIVVEDPKAMTKSVIDAVMKADVRCILSKGWSDRLDNKTATTQPEVPLPPEIHQISAAPHDWLFRQIDAAAHHGGAGTTGASLRAGIPTIIKPFFGDQFFFASRVEDLRVGMYIKKLNTSVLSRALWRATRDERMINKARVLGEQIRKEDGVGTAIKTIYRDLEYAKSLIKRRAPRDKSGAASSDQNNDHHNDSADEAEEEWTFVEDDSDPELRKLAGELALDPSGAGKEAPTDAAMAKKWEQLVEQQEVERRVASGEGSSGRASGALKEKASADQMRGATKQG